MTRYSSKISLLRAQAPSCSLLITAGTATQDKFGTNSTLIKSFCGEHSGYVLKSKPDKSFRMCACTENDILTHIRPTEVSLGTNFVQAVCHNGTRSLSGFVLDVCFLRVCSSNLQSHPPIS